MSEKSNITPEMKSHIGVASTPVESNMEANISEHRRFVHAIMDEDPIYHNEEFAKTTRYEVIVCPPLFPLSVNRRPLGSSDNLSEGFRKNPEFDALMSAVDGTGAKMDLSHIPRMLNGGNEIEFFKYMKIGEKTSSVTKVVDILEKEGRSGPMVFIISETEVRNNKGELLLISRSTAIRR